MFITEAFAQTAPVAGGGTADILMSILPFLLIFVVMYFLIIRPQRANMKRREELLKRISVAATRSLPVAASSARSRRSSTTVSSKWKLLTASRFVWYAVV